MTVRTLPKHTAATLTEYLDDFAEEIARANEGAEFTFSHGLAEGAEHDHRDEQDTHLILRDGHGVNWVHTYRLPAKADDEGVTYRRAFEAADDLIHAWLIGRGIEPSSGNRYGTGWDVGFSRDTWVPTILDEVRVATAVKVETATAALEAQRAWVNALRRATEVVKADPSLQVADIVSASGVSRDGYYKAIGPQL